MPTLIDEDGCRVELVPDWLAPAEAARVFGDVHDEVPWAEREIVLFGRRVLQPRLVAWLGDPDAAYTYSRVRLEPEPWTPVVATLSERLAVSAREQGIVFEPNGVLCNLYRSGADSMGFHSDDEDELGPRPTVASVSLGGSRRFVLRRRDDRRRRVEIELPSGSLLWMLGDTQRLWQHGLPRTALRVAPRINLTFRRIVSSPP
jgi:alkylated DNA repair dioxygenase AlkB